MTIAPTANPVVYSNNGLSFGTKDPGYQVQPGEVAFDHLATDVELAAAFPSYTAAKAIAQAPAQFDAAVSAGLTITSTGTPALNGTYAVDTAARDVISAVEAGIAGGKGLPGGGSTFNHLDIAGVPHAFDATSFPNFAAAVRDYYYALIQTLVSIKGGHGGTWPSASATIP